MDVLGDSTSAMLDGSESEPFGSQSHEENAVSVNSAVHNTGDALSLGSLSNELFSIDCSEKKSWSNFQEDGNDEMSASHSYIASSNGISTDKPTPPTELSTWILMGELKMDNGDQVVTLRVQDGRGKVLREETICHSNDLTSKDVLGFIQRTCESPVIGVPRRPTNLYVFEPSIRDLVPPSILWDLFGIELSLTPTSKGSLCTCLGVLRTERNKMSPLRACAVCYYQAEDALLMPCPNCHLFLYCSLTCMESDQLHLSWCSIFKGFEGLNKEMSMLPFTFTEQTLSSSFTAYEQVEFLKRLSIFRKGYWREESPVCCQQLSAINSNADNTNPFVLLREAIYLDISETDTFAPLPQPIASWADYYEVRGFEMSSPIAVLMQWPLTLYYILSQLISNSAAKWTVYIGGANKEVHLVSIFFELAFLLPDIDLHLVFIGLEVPASANGKTLKRKNITVEIVLSSVEHYLLRAHTNTPNTGYNYAFVAFNAGLPAYHQWKVALPILGILNIPTFFTDYCGFTYLLSKKAIEDNRIGSLSEMHLNPFRCPFRKVAEEHNLVWMSNAYIFQLTPSK